MFFVSLHRPSKQQEQSVCEKGQRLGFNFRSAGSSKEAPPLPPAAAEDGWWNVDHARVKVGYGKQTYTFTRELLLNWGQFQLPWAQVDPSTATKAGTPVCVCANVFGLWTAVPLEVVYKQEGRWKGARQPEPLQQLEQQSKKQQMVQAQQQQQQQQQQQRQQQAQHKQRRGRHTTYAHACLGSHYLAGEERFRVEWDQTDDSVWYDIYTYSRPHHPLAFLGYPVVRVLQQRFRSESMRAVARAAACQVVDSSLDDETRRRLEQSDGLDLGFGKSRRWPFAF